MNVAKQTPNFFSSSTEHTVLTLKEIEIVFFRVGREEPEFVEGVHQCFQPFLNTLSLRWGEKLLQFFGNVSH